MRLRKRQVSETRKEGGVWGACASSAALPSPVCRLERTDAYSEPVDLAPDGVLRVRQRADCFCVLRDFSLRAIVSLVLNEVTNGVGDSVECWSAVEPVNEIQS